MTLRINDAEFGDYPFLSDTFRQANREHCSMRPDLYRPVDVIIPKHKYLMAVAARHFGVEPVTLKIAHLDGQPVGMVYVESVNRSSLSWSAFEKQACLDNVVVTPGQRRQGIGLALVEAAKDWAIKTGHRHMYAKILTQNAASLALFKKAGLNTDSVNVGVHLT